MFQKAEIKRWRRAVHKEIDRLGAVEDGDFRAAAMVMLTVGYFGTDLAVLCEITGQPAPFVRGVLKRLRQQRVLVWQTLRVRWAQAGFEGLLSVCLDALVAKGRVHAQTAEERSALQTREGQTMTAAIPHQDEEPQG